MKDNIKDNITATEILKAERDFAIDPPVYYKKFAAAYDSWAGSLVDPIISRMQEIIRMAELRNRE